MVSIGFSLQETGFLNLETNIRWAEVFILVYSVTDKCSFDECNRLKFLINYNKRRRKLGSTNAKVGISVILHFTGISDRGGRGKRSKTYLR